MEIFLNVIIIIAAILLILVVLVQKSKGGGLASDFSGVNNVLGIRRATDSVEKATWILAAVIIVCSILAVGVNISKSHKANAGSAISDRIEANTSDPAAGAASFGEEAESQAE